VKFTTDKTQLAAEVGRCLTFVERKSSIVSLKRITISR